MRLARACVMAAVAAAALAGCAAVDDGPIAAAARLTLDRDAVPFSAPLAMTYAFTVAPDAPPPGGDYRIAVAFRDPAGTLLWRDDHDPPPPVADWQPGTTVTYTRDPFLPVVQYLGPVEVDVALESASTGDRLRLDAPPAGGRTYRLATFDLEPQTLPVEFGAGWYAREDDGADPPERWRWTAGEARLRFPNPGADATLHFDLDQPVGALVGPQAVTVRFGDLVLDTFEMTGPRQHRRIGLPGELLGGAPSGELTVTVDPVFVPRALEGLAGSTDDRVLGVRVFHAILLPS